MATEDDAERAVRGALDLVAAVSSLKHRSRVVRSLPWEGKLLTQPERHDEAREWFFANIIALRRGLDRVAAVVTG